MFRYLRFRISCDQNKLKQITKKTVTKKNCYDFLNNPDYGSEVSSKLKRITTI